MKLPDRPRYYRLNDDHTVTPCSLEEYGNEDSRRVGYTELPDGQRVSTVFLGLDHQYWDGPPLLFETMVFPDCEYMQRYTTWDQAVRGHEEAVRENTESYPSVRRVMSNRAQVIFLVGLIAVMMVIARFAP